MENILIRARALRQMLHVYPELSGSEVHTATVVRECMQAYHPDEIIDHVGGNGIAFIYSGGKRGKTLLFRADTDALPIQENNSMLYKSRNNGIAHLCGHDGHTAILAGLGDLLNRQRPEKGKVILLFQPAEETGQGAASVLKDNRINRFEPDFVFALHNLPGYSFGSIITRSGVFASASKGLIIHLKGVPAHAAYPENGISPAPVLAELIKTLPELQHQDNYSDMVMLTIVHARLGEPAFGVSPSDAILMATLRSFEVTDMDVLTDKILEYVQELCLSNKVQLTIEWTDEFIPVVNSTDAVSIIEDAAKSCGYAVIKPVHPFPWSEDFGQFTALYNGAMFGLGAGEEHQPLHSPYYDFPDGLIEKGINMFYQIVKQITKD